MICIYLFPDRWCSWLSHNRVLEYLLTPRRSVRHYHSCYEWRLTEPMSILSFNDVVWTFKKYELVLLIPTHKFCSSHSCQFVQFPTTQKRRFIPKPTEWWKWRKIRRTLFPEQNDTYRNAAVWIKFGAFCFFFRCNVLVVDLLTLINGTTVIWWWPCVRNLLETQTRSGGGHKKVKMTGTSCEAACQNLLTLIMTAEE